MQKFQKDISAAALFVWSTISVILQIKGVYELIPFVSEGLVVSTLLTIAAMSAFYLITGTINNTWAWIKERKKKKERFERDNKPKWDTTAQSAANYICYESRLKETLKGDIDKALTILVTAIKSGNIRVGHLKDYAIEQEKPEFFDTLKMKGTTDRSYSSKRMESVMFLEDATNNVVVKAVYLDGREVRTLWPH